MVDIRILQERIEENSKKLVYIFNPTSKTFTITHQGNTWTVLPSQELELPYYTAELFVTRITDFMGSQLDRHINPQMKKEFEKRVRLYDKDPIA